ncbi:hypothetical protein BKA56DRAFT_699613, partial [Ilyonectria sp. MPI-CAGE-AT-0026]
MVCSVLPLSTPGIGSRWSTRSAATSRSVNIDELSPEFKQENCVYPRACWPKEQYRGNRLMYETECNRVGCALAQLNVPLRGKRGLIQRAVDSWRNSNHDPRLPSRRVRRRVKMNNGKQVQASPHPGAAH